MKTLVIPDIHCKWQKADSIIKNYENQVDEIVLLGDYFDDFYDTPGLNKRTAKWLKKYLQEDNHIALLGNHELNYIYNKDISKCSGYNSAKKHSINTVLSISEWNKLELYYYTQGYLLTHAGVSAPLVSNPVVKFDKDKFYSEMKTAKEYLRFGKLHKYLYQVGSYRGGRYIIGGILWCHYPDEFISIPEIKQIFGHTPGDKVRNTNYNWCIDTHLKNCIIIDDEKVNVINI